MIGDRVRRGGRPGISRLPALLIVALLAGCGTTPSSAAGPTPSGSAAAPPSASPSVALGSATPGASIASPAARTLLLDTDVAADDLIAISLLVAAPNVTLAGITVSGTGEAHCAGGVDVVLRLLERLQAPQIPVACGRETPLAGEHAFPDAWRQAVDGGSGLVLPSTTRRSGDMTAGELITKLSADHPGLDLLTTGPLTNLADALQLDPDLGDRLGRVVVMGGALHVPGNIAGPGAPQGNALAEWNVYVDPHAAQIVVDAGLDLVLVPLDATNQVPVTYELIGRALEPSDARGRRVLADLFRANPFMSSGYYLWDPLAAEVAAGYEVGAFSDARIQVLDDDGPASGYTKPMDGPSNLQFLGDVDAPAAADTLLRILDGH